MTGKCCKCGKATDCASVDLTASLCLDCAERFNQWCDSHPTRPYADFVKGGE